MTTLYVREGSAFREAEDEDILTRAHALIAQRYQPGAPTMADPFRTAEFLRIHFTRKLKSLLALLDVRVLDHLIVADQIFSFANAKLL
jgi:hypothetical protein